MAGDTYSSQKHCTACGASVIGVIKLAILLAGQRRYGASFHDPLCQNHDEGFQLEGGKNTCLKKSELTPTIIIYTLDLNAIHGARDTLIDFLESPTCTMFSRGAWDWASSCEGVI